jgi:hypothetical protein
VSFSLALQKETSTPQDNDNDKEAVDAVADSEADTLELDLLNALGEKGWELFWTRQEKDGSWFFFLPSNSP